MTTTIYIPAADYVQRYDYEGRDYLALRTIRAAADRWVGTGRQCEVTPGDGTAVFAERTGDDVHLTTVTPDPDMEDLYPADALPFTIKALPAWTTGDYIAMSAHRSTQTWRVDERQRDGYKVTYIGGDLDMQRGNIGDDLAHLYVKVPAPTVTYAVTIRADIMADSVFASLSALDAGVEVKAP